MEFVFQDFLWHVVSTSLFIIGTYSFAVWFRIRQSSFLFYTIFSYLLLGYMVLRSPYLSESFSQLLRNSDLNVFFWLLQVFYNGIYFYFFLSFLDVKKHLPSVDRFIKISIPIIIFSGLVLALVSLLFLNYQVFRSTFIYGFSPVFTILSIFVLIRLWAIPGKLKYFFFIGSSTYLLGALTSLVLSVLGLQYDTTYLIAPICIYYIGLFIEQIFFGLCLSLKVQLINDERIRLSRQNEDMNKNMNIKLRSELEKREKEIRKIEKEIQEARLEKLKMNYDKKINELKLHSLRSQMNPHFIFNALNSIKSALIENDQNMAIDYLSQFSSLLRKVLESSKNELITLDEELQIINKYVQVENSRFDDDIDLRIQKMDKRILKMKFPPLILQPIVENAIWHGLVPLDKEKEKKIVVHYDENSEELIIEDNGIGLDKARQYRYKRSRKSNSLGIDNIKERLIYFNKEYGKNFSLVLTQKTSSSGTRAILRFRGN